MILSNLLSLFVFIQVLVHYSSSSPLNKTLVDENTNNEVEDEDAMTFYTLFGSETPNKTPEGDKIYEGDIVIQEKEESLHGKKAVADTSILWPNAEVIYTYHESINHAEMTVIEAAMQHWRKHTCIKFRPRQEGDFFFVRFRSDTQGCWSLVGRQAERMGHGQDVSIGAGCANLNIVVHEIGHVLGFYHEQSRSDRDQHINIVWNNVLNGYDLQFRKESDNSYGIPYDLTSTMQYPQWAFSKELFEKSTIVAINPAYQRFLSKNYPLSFRDRQLANILYGCSGSCGSNDIGGATCSNGGYARQTTGELLGSRQGIFGGEQCSCDCPPNYSGSKCETILRSEYYDTLPCGGNIDKPGYIETPNYPQRTAPKQSCMWDITAPSLNQYVKLRFEGFEFAPRFTKLGTKVINKCFNETVEIRLKNSNIYDGDFYCGTDIAPGAILTSDGPRATILITANDRMYGSGLRAKVTFPRIGTNEDDNDDTIIQSTTPDNNGFTTAQPITDLSTVTSPTIFTLPPFTFGPIGTLRPPTQPTFSTTTTNEGIVTSSNLLEEYVKESTKTFPPMIPM